LDLSNICDEVNNNAFNTFNLVGDYHLTILVDDNIKFCDNWLFKFGISETSRKYFSFNIKRMNDTKSVDYFYKSLHDKSIRGNFLELVEDNDARRIEYYIDHFMKYAFRHCNENVKAWSGFDMVLSKYEQKELAIVKSRKNYIRDKYYNIVNALLDIDLSSFNGVIDKRVIEECNQFLSGERHVRRHLYSSLYYAKKLSEENMSIIFLYMQIFYNGSVDNGFLAEKEVELIKSFRDIAIRGGSF
jgi:hypothetical protein